MPIKNHMKDSLEELKVTDVYSLVLFSLYKLKDVPEYASLSELVYLLDKDSLFNLLEYYGGMTIKIPTTQELKNLVTALLIFYQVRFEEKDFKEVVKSADVSKSQLSEIMTMYTKLSSILEDYDFKRN